MYARIFPPPPPFPCELAQVLRNCHQSHLLLDLDFVRQFLKPLLFQASLWHYYVLFAAAHRGKTLH